MNKYISYDRDQAYLLPPSIKDWLPQNHLARFIVDIIDQLDISSIDKQYSGRSGKQAYHPKILLGLLFYGYSTGIFSSRKLENAAYDSIAFRYIAANSHPDHDTIANFRQRFLNELEDIFVQILLIAKGSGLLKVGKVSLDGTKIKANASKHKALSYKHAKQLQKQLENEVKSLMAQAKDIDNKDENIGMNIPQEISRREDRLKVIKDAISKIEIRSITRYEKDKKEYDNKLKYTEDTEKLTGKKSKGRVLKEPDSTPNDKDQVNLTDDESRIMPVSGGGYMQAYNGQASVEHDSRLTVHQHLTQNSNDKQEVIPSFKWYDKHPSLKPVSFLADAGYFSKDNIQLCEDKNTIPYISFGKEHHNQALETRFTDEEPLPPNPTIVEKLKHRLQTKEGKQIYSERKSTVEPVFGIIKHVIGFRQFMFRGFKKAKGEWNLVCIGYNLKRLHIISC